MDVDSLSLTQRDALAQLQTLTNGGDAEVAIGVLSSVDWDVQVCTLVSTVKALHGGRPPCESSIDYTRIREVVRETITGLPTLPMNHAVSSKL